MRIVIALVAAGTLLAAASLPAQTSVGFSRPDDLGALLAYRLPDWGYRTWDATLGFAGRGQDGDRISNSNRSELATTARFFRESESRVWSGELSAGGLFAHDHAGGRDPERSTRAIDGEGELSLALDQYLGDSEVYLLGGADGLASYVERRETGVEEITDYSRRYRYGARAGIGVGRVRDVTPLIRAERLSERLAALGRGPLSRAQVVAVAEYLAREAGYRVVFDRADRRFWRDVLEPLLATEAPLSVYEIEYLEEVLLEDIGSRGQGQAVEAWYRWQEERRSGPEELVIPAGEFGATARWQRNLTLEQQLSLSVSAGYLRGHALFGRYEQARLFGYASYLHNLSDRNRLDVILRLLGSYREDRDAIITRDLQSMVRIEDRFYIEDRVVLRPYVEAAYLAASNNVDLPVDPRVSWRYGLGLDYYFDRLLF